jgi:hypothetical protein
LGEEATVGVRVLSSQIDHSERSGDSPGNYSRR